MDLLFVMDPLDRLNPATDTTLALMKRAQQSGHGTWAAVPSTLALIDGVPWVEATHVDVSPGKAPRFTAPAEWREVSSFPMVWLRKDPPFDLGYVETTWILDRVDPRRCRVVNDPAGIRGANEKLYALQFSDVCPPSIVTSDARRLRAFVDAHAEIVLKPLGGAGGVGILFASRGMRGLNSVLETATRNGLERCEAQAYLPGSVEGDKRIILLDGEPLGAVLRVHGEGEERNNLHLGGRAEATTLTRDDLRIVERIAPALKRDKLVFVGIDVIQGKLTEVNVTSPTGIQELEQLTGMDACGQVIAWCERHAPRG